MAILKFSATAVAAQIAQACSCSTFLPNWNGPVGKPALILIVGNGVHLRSNGIVDTTTRIVTTEDSDPSFAFADGINPFRDMDWMSRRREAFRDLTGQFYTDILDDVQMLIDRGAGTIRLATDGHTIRIFVRRASDYLIGGTYDVPSGLGGTFRVILKDACDTFAVVENCGNCEDFDKTSPTACRSTYSWSLMIRGRRNAPFLKTASPIPCRASRSRDIGHKQLPLGSGPIKCLAADLSS